jgi:hypothetical protein
MEILSRPVGITIKTLRGVKFLQIYGISEQGMDKFSSQRKKKYIFSDFRH